MSEYIAGACNIGEREITRRRAVGVAALIFALFSAYTLVMIDANASARLGVFFPALVSGIGFIQARNKFCLAYGFAGTFNFGKIGDMERVFDLESKRKDRAKAVAILGQAAIMAGVATILFLFLPI